jgi:multicomponent Na+:H+ antiporter subunit G
MAPDWIVLVSCILLLVGSVFTFLAALGVLRLPDVYTRMHAASKAGVVGGGLVLLAVALMSQDAAVAIRAIIGIVFLLLTTPVSAHLLAKASLSSGHEPVGTSITQENTANATESSVA